MEYSYKEQKNRFPISFGGVGQSPLDFFDLNGFGNCEV